MTVTTQAVQDYVKAIYKLEERGVAPTTGALAELLDVAPASVTGMLRRLAALKLVAYERYRPLQLTLAGRKVALEVIRHHRLIELYLAEALGMPWDRVHDEAERLEHVISEELEDRMAAALGDPQYDPHGDPIPARDGTLPAREVRPLASLDAGETATVARVLDDEVHLRALGRLGLYPGTALQVLAVKAQGAAGAAVVLSVDGRTCELAYDLAVDVEVMPAKAVHG